MFLGSTNRMMADMMPHTSAHMPGLSAILTHAIVPVRAWDPVMRIRKMANLHHFSQHKTCGIVEN